MFELIKRLRKAIFKTSYSWSARMKMVTGVKSVLLFIAFKFMIIPGILSIRIERPSSKHNSIFNWIKTK